MNVNLYSAISWNGDRFNALSHTAFSSTAFTSVFSHPLRKRGTGKRGTKCRIWKRRSRWQTGNGLCWRCEQRVVPLLDDRVVNQKVADTVSKHVRTVGVTRSVANRCLAEAIPPLESSRFGYLHPTLVQSQWPSLCVAVKQIVDIWHRKRHQRRQTQPLNKFVTIDCFEDRLYACAPRLVISE